MTETWGAWDGHLRVGRGEYTRSTTEPSALIPFYLGTDGFDYQETSVLEYSGDISGDITFDNDLGSGDDSNHQGQIGDAKLVEVKEVTGTPGQLVSCTARLQANGLGESPYITVTIRLADVPSAPVAPEIHNVGKNTALVMMELPHENFSPLKNTVFRLWDAETGGNLVAEDTVRDLRKSYIFNNLTEGTEYWVEVLASNDIGEGVPSERVSFTTVADYPVVDPLAGVGTKGIVKVFIPSTGKWEPVAGTNGVGIPVGGGANSLLAKLSSQNYDTGWVASESVIDLPSSTLDQYTDGDHTVVEFIPLDNIGLDATGTSPGMVPRSVGTDMWGWDHLTLEDIEEAGDYVLFTQAERDKLANTNSDLASSDWEAADGQPGSILNKPTLGSMSEANREEFLESDWRPALFDLTDVTGGTELPESGVPGTFFIVLPDEGGS